MKKIVFLLIAVIGLMSITASTKAQVSFNPTSYNPTGAIVDNGVDTLNMTLSGTYNKQVGIQLVVTKSTGTAAGTARLYGSLYGTTGTWSPVSDTLTLTNSTVNSKYWTVSEPTYKYLRILIDGGTTVNAIASAKALGIKPN